MKEFILLVWVPLSYSGAKAKEVNPAWEKVTAKWKADNVFVVSYVYPGESRILTGANRELRSGPSVAGDRKLVSSILVRAASYDAAVELAKQAPVLDHGGAVEVREVPPR